MSRQRVLITGAASGLGAALAEAFEARGDEVLRTDVAYGGVSTSSTSGGSTSGGSTSGGGLHLDITSDADWAAARDHVEATWGGLDVLVNNAGVAGGGRLDVAGLDEWQWITEINLFGAVRGTRAFVPMFKRQRTGRIVNVASLAGLVHPAGMASYNAVKAAVVALTETTGHELAAYGVTAHVVCPSYFRTNLMSSLRGRDEALGAIMAKLVTDSPTSAADIAAAVLEGLDRGDELIVPDDAARFVHDLKRTDRASYDAIMRDQARKLDQAADVEPVETRAGAEGVSVSDVELVETRAGAEGMSVSDVELVETRAGAEGVSVSDVELVETRAGAEGVSVSDVELVETRAGAEGVSTSSTSGGGAA